MGHGCCSPPFFVVAKEKQRRGPLAGRQLAASSPFVFRLFPFSTFVPDGRRRLSTRPVSLYAISTGVRVE